MQKRRNLTLKSKRQKNESEKTYRKEDPTKRKKLVENDMEEVSSNILIVVICVNKNKDIVKTPNGVQKRKGSFRFSNFITEKKNFMSTVKSVWDKNFEGRTMYRVVQKMKLLKKKLKKMSWENGNVFERVEILRNKDYQEAIQEEYSLLCQKAKVEWLKEGDRNIAYFHKTIKERVHRGQSKEVHSLAKRQNIFINKVNTEEAQRMVRAISDSEIKNAMFEIEDSKAPGPDGYTARFYKSAWSIVGKEICQAIKEFFLNGKLLGEVNATLISLVPKIPGRPIACCNVLYKCISKILTSRIKGVLGKLVGENQSEFIEGRQITDNILLSQELFKGYNRKQHTKKFSINVNGERVGYFKGGRGHRQGDPISPYLFTLVMEVLNLLIQKNIEESKGFKYHFGCKKLKITHLCFVDDLLIFCHGDLESVKIMKKSLDEFSGVSSLLPNMHKSTVFFGGLSSAEQHSIINIIPFSVGKLPIRYLGVPLLTKKLNISDCKPLISKVKTKVNDWKNKALSYAGRVIYEINKILKGFLWCQGELTKGKAKISWDKICKPKDQGGLGLKDLGVWNEVLMTKHLWNVAVKKNTLWVKWIYMEKLKDKSIWEANSDTNCTVGWKNILSLRDKIRKHIRWKIGNGNSVNVWHDNWCVVSPLSDFIETKDIYDARLSKNYSINDIINEGRWKWPEE
ncbi:RNA-directed DNA polymerase, eukaryota, reverse transcriptase zinc-binding domain protein [Tanacetum coccineum]